MKRPAINPWRGDDPRLLTPTGARPTRCARPTTLKGLRDRAILSIGLQVGLRRSEIIRLKVRDLQTTGGYDALRVTRKRGKQDVIAIHPETAQRLRSYLDASGHGQDLDGPLFGRCTRMAKRRGPPASGCQRIDWILHKYVTQLGLGHGYSAHSMRATFITTALENGAKLEDVQRTVGHADPSTTQLYDRGRFMPKKSAALMVDYGPQES